MRQPLSCDRCGSLHLVPAVRLEVETEDGSLHAAPEPPAMVIRRVFCPTCLTQWEVGANGTLFEVPRVPVE